MPKGPAYSIEGYRNKLRTTQSNVLLVEGTQDKRAFQILIAEAEGSGRRAPRNVIIDSAQSIIGRDESIPSNREKVERVFDQFDASSLAVQVVGFVDREFRDFDLPALIDHHSATHHVTGQVVWSRGHSLENYFFEFPILRRVLQAIAITDSYGQAIGSLGAAFDSVLRLACAISLAGHQHQQLDVIARTLDATIISILDLEANLVPERWREHLEERNGGDRVLAQTIIDSCREWEQELVAPPIETIRWLCHGHIGLEMLWAAYLQCIALAGGNQTEQAHASRAKKEQRADICAHEWVTRALRGQSVWPEIVLLMLGFSAGAAESLT